MGAAASLNDFAFTEDEIGLDTNHRCRRFFCHACKRLFHTQSSVIFINILKFILGK